MDFFGLNRFLDGPERAGPPKKGPGRYAQALWENLGGLLGGNLLTFIGFLPLALGVSLGLVYENFWITVLSGAVGGALAGAAWTAMLALALQAFRGGTKEWFRRWREALARRPAAAAALGAALGGLTGVLLLAGGLMGQSAGGMVPVVSVFLALDGFAAALAATAFFPCLCVTQPDLPQLARALGLMLLREPGRVLGAAAAVLFWCALVVALFPVSVPFSLVLGFWPPALLTAQLILPPMEAVLELPGGTWAEFEPEPPVPGKDGLTAGQRGEIWWRRRWPLVVAGVLCVSLALGTISTLLSVREPDLQIAVVHCTALPDGVREALEASLSARVGDRNGDGTTLVQVNDYTVVFDGSAEDMDMQTAGVTLLVTDLAAGDSAFFLVEDPEGFLARYGDQVNGENAARWAEYPVLAALDAGTWSTAEDIYTDRDGQELLEPLTVLPGASAPAELLESLLGR